MKPCSYKILIEDVLNSQCDEQDLRVIFSAFERIITPAIIHAHNKVTEQYKVGDFNVSLCSKGEKGYYVWDLHFYSSVKFLKISGMCEIQ